MRETVMEKKELLYPWMGRGGQGQGQQEQGVNVD